MLSFINTISIVIDRIRVKCCLLTFVSAVRDVCDMSAAVITLTVFTLLLHTDGSFKCSIEVLSFC